MRRSIGFFSMMAVLSMAACGADLTGVCFDIVTGCGGEDEGPDRSEVNVGGTWDVVITVTGGTQAPAGTQFSATFTLAQGGGNVTGRFAREGGVSGQLTGRVVRRSFTSL